jgi:hypothetical protein
MQATPDAAVADLEVVPTPGDVSAREDVDVDPQLTQWATFLQPVAAAVFPMDSNPGGPPPPRIRLIHLEAILTEALYRIAPRKL